MQMEWVKSNLLRTEKNNSVTGTTEENVNLLESWRSYTTERDVETGSAGVGNSKAAILQTVGKAQTTISTFFQEGYNRVSSGVNSGVQAVSSGEVMQIPSSEQLMFFFSFLAAGVVFLTLAFTLFLPTIIIAPSKFAVSFSLGCLCIMTGFIVLRGLRQQFQHMLSRERLPFTAVYVSSVLATIYVSTFLGSYILSIVFSGVQVVALLYYLMSYFPGGAQGVLVMLRIFGRAAAGCFSGLVAMASRV